MSARNTPVRGSLEHEVRYAVRAVLAIVLACIVTCLWVMAAWADEVPKELHGIWCADRPRLGDPRCVRFGPDYIVVEGHRADSVTVEVGPQRSYHVVYNYADVFLQLVFDMHDDHLIERDNYGSVRYNRGEK